MKHVETKKTVKRVRPAFGQVRQVLLEGESMYREARRDDVEFEIPHDEYAWDVCGPIHRLEFIEV